MKNKNRSIKVLFLIAITLTIVNVNIGKVYAKSLTTLEKEQVISTLLEYDRISLFRDATLEIWGEKDREYLENVISGYNKDKLTQLMTEESHQLSELRDELRSEYISVDNARVWSPYKIEKIHVVDTAYDSRIKIIECLIRDENMETYEYAQDIFKGINNYSTESKITGRIKREDLRKNIEDTIEVLTEYSLPDGLIENLDILISPYTFKGVTGYAELYSIEGREETITISNNRENRDYKITLLHELGHVFMYDIAGMAPYRTDSNGYMYKNKDIWAEYERINPDLDYEMDAEWERNPSENMAEDFQNYITLKNGYTKIERQVDSEYTELSEQFMENSIKNYNPNTNKSHPSTIIKTSDTEMHLNYGQYLKLATNSNTLSLNGVNNNEDNLYITLATTDYDAIDTIQVTNGGSISLPGKGLYYLVMEYKINGIMYWSGIVEIYKI